MPHALAELKLTAATRPAAAPAHDIQADVCVVGAGIAGLPAPGHAPVKRGGRFSVKALTPSAKSPEALISCWILASNSSCSPIRW
jgi:hypothetical protein